MMIASAARLSSEAIPSSVTMRTAGVRRSLSFMAGTKNAPLSPIDPRGAQAMGQAERLCGGWIRRPFGIEVGSKDKDMEFPLDHGCTVSSIEFPLFVSAIAAPAVIQDTSMAGRLVAGSLLDRNGSKSLATWRQSCRQTWRYDDIIVVCLGVPPQLILFHGVV